MYLSTLNYSAPGSYSYTVPSTVTRVVIAASGGGGRGEEYEANVSWGSGGPGGYATASYTVSSGQVIQILVGAGIGNESSASISGGFQVRGDGGGNAYEIEGEGHDGAPGAGYFDSSSGSYVASSGQTTTGGGGAGGQPGYWGGDGSVSIALYTAYPPSVTSPTTVFGPSGTAVSYQISAIYNPTSYGASGLPSGLSINTSTGLISGTIGSPGTYYFTVTASNGNGTGQATVGWMVNANPVASAASTVSGVGATTAWGGLPGVSSYLLDVSSQSNFATYVNGMHGVALVTTSCIIGGLTPNTTYYYRVRAAYSSGTSENSNVVSFFATDGMLYATQTFNNPGTYSYTIPANAARVAISAIGAGGRGESYEGEWSGWGGSGGLASARYNVASGNTLSITLTDYAQVGVNGAQVIAYGGGGAYEIEGSGYDGSPGTASFGTGTGYLAGSGWAITGGAGNGGAPGDNGGPSNVTINVYTLQAPTVTSPTNVAGPVGTAINYQITAENGSSSFGASGLPPGLSVNTTTGVVSGTIAATGSYSFTVSATNANGTGSATITLTIQAPPVANNPFDVVNYGFIANWSPLSGATAYLLDVSTNSAFSTFVSGNQARNVGNVSSFAVSGLTPNTFYYYRVRAVYSIGTSSSSNVVALQTINGVLISDSTYGSVGNYSYTIPAGATRLWVRVQAAGGHGVEYETWGASGGAGGQAVAVYSVTAGQVVNISVGGGGTDSNSGYGGASSAGITGGFSMSATGGAPAYSTGEGEEEMGHDGAPGTGTFDPAHGHLANSGFAGTGGGGNGGAPNESGQNGAVIIMAYIAPTPPVFTLQPVAQVASPGTGVTFTVATSGNPAPVFQWRKNGTNISGATRDTLAIPSVQSADAASYSVVANNAAGAATSNAVSLTVSDVAPSVPTALNYVEKTETTVTLIWNPSYDDVGVVGYTVFRGGTQIGTTTDRVYVDSGLTASTSYSYTVKALDTAAQSSNASSALSVTTNASSSADSDHDGIPDGVETALGTAGSTAATAATTTQTQQVIHRPIQ